MATSINDYPVKAISIVKWMKVFKRRLDWKDEYHWNDYRSLGDLMGFNHDDLLQIETLSGGPTYNLLLNWKNRPDATVGKLLEMLDEMEQEDLKCDVLKMVKKQVIQMNSFNTKHMHHPPFKETTKTSRIPKLRPSYEKIENTTFQRYSSTGFDENAQGSGMCLEYFAYFTWH